MAKTVNLSMDSIKQGFADLQKQIIGYFTSLDTYERYANIAMLVGLLLIIIAVIL